MAQSIPAKAEAPEIISRDPATGEEIGRVPLTLPEEVARAVDRARAAQTAWARTSFRARGQIILRVGFLAYGTFGFTPDITNNAAASFLMGKLRTFRQGFGEFKDNRSKYAGLYFQDDYHVSRRLTLNLGVRWEPFFPQQEVRGRIEQFRQENYYANIRS